MIGANGAGKTTIIESIEGLRSQYTGSIDVLGIDPKHNRRRLYQQIGVQLQETKYQDKIKVSELGKLFGTINEHFNNEFDKMHKNDLAG
jgi:ABC-2 type transport system ATP-binding protein